MIDRQHHSLRSVATMNKTENKHSVGLADINLDTRSKTTKHLRGRSDIDSLSPEVRRALHLTFGGKLNEIRSKIHASLPSPPSSPLPSAPSSPLLSAPSSPLPSHPSSPPPCPLPTPPSLQRTFAERLGDKEGAHMLVSYFSAILLSGCILSSAGGDGGQDPKEVCGERISDGCARFYGYILPIGLSSIFFTFALVFFVFDVMFSLFHILANAEDFYRRRYVRDSIMAKSQHYENGDKERGWAKQQSGHDVDADKESSVTEQQSDQFRKECSWAKQLTEHCDQASHHFAAGRLALFLMIDLAFIIAVSILLWMSKTSTVDPLYTICEERLKLVWMFGLMVIAVIVLLSAIKAFRDPSHSNLPPLSNWRTLTAFKKVSLVFVMLILCNACYYGLSERKQVGQCLRHHPTEENVTRTSLMERHRTNFGGELQEQEFGEDFSLLQSFDKLQQKQMQPWKYPLESDSIERCSECEVDKFRTFDWCEAHYASCEWPQAKQIQPYERKDRCPTVLPWCDWPQAKQVQPYENQHRCPVKSLLQCEWSRVKRIQVYEHEEQCKPMVHLACEWPWLKQIEIFQEKDRCPAKNTQQCEWPWLKQVQIFRPRDLCLAKNFQQCERSREAHFA